MGKKTKTEDAFIWRVMKTEEGGIEVGFGPKLSESGSCRGCATQLGTQLMGSTVRDDDDDWGDE